MAIPEPPAPPLGSGWQYWFEVSERAARDAPWYHERVEMWRPNWQTPRVVRAADVPYQHDGPGFWWRPWRGRTSRGGTNRIERRKDA